MGRASREKGKRGEREAAAELGAIFGVDARRGVQYQGGPDSPDVVLQGVPIHVEAKRTERLSLWPAVEQARADAKTGSVPIVWHKANRRPSVVIIETARLWEFVHAMWTARSTHDETHGTPADAPRWPVAADRCGGRVDAGCQGDGRQEATGGA